MIHQPKDDPDLMAIAERVADMNVEACAAFEAEARRLELSDDEETLAYQVWTATDAAARAIVFTPRLDGPARGRVMRMASFLSLRSIELAVRTSALIDGPGGGGTAALSASAEVIRERNAEAARSPAPRSGWSWAVNWSNWSVGASWARPRGLPGFDGPRRWTFDLLLVGVFLGPVVVRFAKPGPPRDVRVAARWEEVGHG